jgi:spermidine/putrescine transport system substrate-binding protein
MQLPFARRFVLPLLLLLAAPALSAAGRLHVFIWSEYLDPAVVRDFETAHDVRVTVDVYEDAESMLAKLQGGGDAQYDVVCVPDHLVPAAVKLRLVAPLRHANLPNLRHLEPRFRHPPFDSNNVHTVAYQWGTLGLYFRRLPGRPAPDSWGALFDPAREHGPFTLLDSLRDTIGAALKFQGHSLNATGPAQLRAARDLILAAKPRAVGFENTVGGKNRVLARTAALALVYSGEAARGMAEDAETAYVIPKEGSQIWLDTLAVCARAPHRDLAEKFLNWVLDPVQGARLANFTRFASPNAAARPHLNPEDLKNPAIYPPDEVMARLEFLRDLGPRTRLYDEVWTQIKAR